LSMASKAPYRVMKLRHEIDVIRKLSWILGACKDNQPGSLQGYCDRSENQVSRGLILPYKPGVMIRCDER